MINDKKATAVRTADLTNHTSYKTFRKEGDYMKFFGAEDFEEGVEFYDQCRQTVPSTYIINAQVDVLDPKSDLDDGVHPNTGGYQKMFEKIKSELNWT